MSAIDLVVVLPGLLPPADAGLAPPSRPDGARAAARTAPALARLLALAGEPTVEPDGIGAALAPLYGIARQADWPLAPVRAAALGQAAGSDYWLAADPVLLEAGRDDVRLVARVADLSADEAAALVATLNAHFAADGIAFVAPRPDAWFVRCASVPRLATRPLDAALGRTLRALLPEGADAPRWRRWGNEIQMLLHEHPINAARAAAGRRPVNSVWLSTGGTLPPPAVVPVATFANGGVAVALAAHAGRPARPVPAELGAALDAAPGAAATATVVVALPAPADAALVDRAWAQPAWKALARGRLRSVTVIANHGGDRGGADGEGEALAWRARRPSLRQRVAARFGSPDLDALLAARAPAGAR